MSFKKFMSQSDGLQSSKFQISIFKPAEMKDKDLKKGFIMYWKPCIDIHSHDELSWAWNLICGQKEIDCASIVSYYKACWMYNIFQLW